MTNIIFKQNYTPGRLQRSMLKRCGLALFFSTAVLLVTACGGGGGGATPVSAPTPTPKAWGTAGLIETDNAGDARKPQLAFDSNGNAFAVWYQSDGTRNNIWANRFQ